MKYGTYEVMGVMTEARELLAGLGVQIANSGETNKAWMETRNWLLKAKGRRSARQTAMHYLSRLSDRLSIVYEPEIN